MDKSYFGVSVVKVGNMSCVPLQRLNNFRFMLFGLNQPEVPPCWFVRKPVKS